MCFLPHVFTCMNATVLLIFSAPLFFLFLERCFPQQHKTAPGWTRRLDPFLIFLLSQAHHQRCQVVPKMAEWGRRPHVMLEKNKPLLLILFHSAEGAGGVPKLNRTGSPHCHKKGAAHSVQSLNLPNGNTEESGPQLADSWEIIG